MRPLEPSDRAEQFNEVEAEWPTGTLWMPDETRQIFHLLPFERSGLVEWNHEHFGLNQRVGPLGDVRARREHGEGLVRAAGAK